MKKAIVIRQEEEKTTIVQILGGLMIGFAVIDFAASFAGYNLTPFLGSASRFSPIVFGLIVDDSIHIISSYRSCIKRNLSIDKSVNYVTQITSRAVIKTTIVIIFTLIPLLFSEFKSVSQLASISIVAAIVAVFFDLIFLPKLLRFFS